MDPQNFRSLQEAYLDVYSEELGGNSNQERVQKRLNKIDADIKKGEEIYARGEHPYQKQKKADEAQEFLRKHPRKKRTQRDEQVDTYDLILFHLLDEGYAETPEAAEVMMVNMSEEWRESIMEGKKPLPVSKMAKQARKKAFELGAEINSPTDEYGDPLPHYTPTEQGNKLSRQVRRMSKVGGSKVKSHIKKGYEMGSYYDPQEAKSKYYWLQRLNFKSPTSF